jgi:hypothetical protein
LNSDNVSKIYCYKCNQKTRQKLLFNKTEADVQEVFFESLKGESRWVIEQREWSIFQCLGCEFLNLEVVTSHAGIDKKWIKHFPGKADRQVPTWIFSLDKKYIYLLSEIYATFNAKSYTLCLMGARTVIDMFIIDKIGDVGTFKDKMHKLEEQKFISVVERECLDATIDAGNASAHRGYMPSEEVLHSIIDIIEHLMKTLILPTKKDKIKNSTPTRK